MWAYLVGLGVLALILVTSHQPRSGFDPRAFVDDDDPLENSSEFLNHVKLFAYRS